MVNKPLIRPYIWGRGTLGGGRLIGHKYRLGNDTEFLRVGTYNDLVRFRQPMIIWRVGELAVRHPTGTPYEPEVY